MDRAEIMNVAMHVIKSRSKKAWIDYDEGADVLYISFVYPPNAVEHEEDEDGIIRNCEGNGDLTGLTVIAASRFAA